MHGKGFKVSTYVQFSTCMYVKLKDGREKGEEGGKSGGEKEHVNVFVYI